MRSKAVKAALPAMAAMRINSDFMVGSDRCSLVVDARLRLKKSVHEELRRSESETDQPNVGFPFLRFSSCNGDWISAVARSQPVSGSCNIDRNNVQLKIAP